METKLLGRGISEVRTKLEENEQPTVYFQGIHQSGEEAKEIEYLARTFYGQVNIKLKQANMNYGRVEAIMGISPEMRKKYLASPINADGKHNSNYRTPNVRIVFAFAICLKLPLSEVDKLLDSADLAPLKAWRVHRGDDLILKYYEKIIDSLKIEEEKGTAADWIYLDEIQKLNCEFVARGLKPLFGSKNGDGKYGDGKYE